MSSAAVPDHFRSCGALSRHWAWAAPGHTAIVCAGRILNYGDFDANSNRIAHATRAAGIARIGILARNSDMYPELLFGIAKAGRIAAVLNWRLAPAELAVIAADASLDMLIYEDEFAAWAAKMLAVLPGAASLRIGSGATYRLPSLSRKRSGDRARAGSERRRRFFAALHQRHHGRAERCCPVPIRTIARAGA